MQITRWIKHVHNLQFISPRSHKNLHVWAGLPSMEKPRPQEMHWENMPQRSTANQSRSPLPTTKNKLL